MDPPQYIHNCDSCKYLGRYEFKCEYECGCDPGKDADLYYCPQGGLPTVIARYSDYGPDYVSGLFADLLILKEAYRRAVEAGFLKEGRK